MIAESQFSFALPLTTAYRAGDFVLAGGNREAYGQVTAWPHWAQSVLVLHGPAASGKTHLAHIWATQGEARCMEAAQLTRDAASTIIAAGEAARPWVVENLENLADEQALFHLLNAVREQGGHLLLTVAQPPAQMAFCLPDLRSRLCAAPLATLEAPDDDVLAAVIHKQFADRQLRVGDEVVRYLLVRMDRSFAAARAWVERIDRAALAGQRRITTALVRELLENGQETSSQGLHFARGHDKTKAGDANPNQ